VRYDWNKQGQPRIGAANRYLGWLLTALAVLCWPLFLFIAITRDWTVAFAPLLPTAGAAVRWLAVRKVCGIRDASRPACAHASAVPVESVTGETVAWLCPDCDQQLDTDPEPPPPPPVPTGSVTAPRSISISGNLIGIASAGDSTLNLVANGFASADEMRERIVQAFSVPPPDTGSAPAWRRYACTCGMEFDGAPADISRSLDVHRTSGQHAQALKARDLRITRDIAATGGMERQRALAAILRTAAVPLPMLTHAKMVGCVERVGAPDIWYVVCGGCGVTINGELEEMSQRTGAHLPACRNLGASAS
jgi:hypothetical protein